MAQSYSPTYAAFHRWLSKNRKSINAPPDCTVIYSGYDSGDVPVWQKLPVYEKFLRETCKPNLRWQPIQMVLENMPVNWKTYQDTEELPPKLYGLKNMWDFGVQAPKLGLVSRSEGQQIWKNLSAWYVKNASGAIYVFDGDRLKEYPDLLLAEIPVLVKNKKLVITPELAKKLKTLIPSSIKAWEKYRADSPERRVDGR